MPFLNCSSSFILSKDLNLVAHLSLNIDTRLLANVKTNSSRNSSISLDKE
jgi:hypothetical protein